MTVQPRHIHSASSDKQFARQIKSDKFKPQMHKRYYLRPLVSACLAILATIPTLSLAVLPLSQSPPVGGGNEPAPNVIISIDDSGSMSEDLNGNSTSNVASTKLTLLKNSLKSVFGDPTASPATTGQVPNARIRLAWQVMHNNGSSSGAGTLGLGGVNSMKPFTGDHRVKFNSFVDSLTAGYNTPSHKMVKQALDYMKTPAGTNSPWANVPGVSQSTPYLACRRSYHIFMTDGGWNSTVTQTVGNADGTPRTLGDGTTSYDPTSAQTRIFKDGFGTSTQSTLADFAFESWASDLQPDMANIVRPVIKKEGNEVIGATTLQQFWNPKNNPATWQHMITNTIGFGSGATRWVDGDGKTFEPIFDVTANSTYGGTSYSKLVNGTVTWPDPFNLGINGRPVELWHMALNGRGKFYPATNENALTSAFAEILGGVIADTSKPLVSIAASSTSLRTNLNAYIAGFAPASWAGSLVARPVSSTTGAVQSAITWDATALLDNISTSVTSRVVISYNGILGINWATWLALPDSQKIPLNKNIAGTVDNKGQARVDYLRGDKTQEESETGGVFRNRISRLGDIVNSNIWYTGRPSSGYTFNNYANFRSATATGGKGGRVPMVYVGANDGMLHGFAAGNWPSDASVQIAGGKELLAYVPQGVAQGDLRKLTDPGYTHQYFVDGSPFTGDAYIGTTPTWATLLVGTLGAGGKGYFVLDVTDPANFTTLNAGNLVVTDTTATVDPDIGRITSPPVVDDAIGGKSRQIVRLNNNRWAAVLGNGYNSTNEAPVLLIQYLDGDKAIKKLSPCANTSGTCSFKGDNGLASPQLIDLDGDGKVDIAYAGDLKGNVWKFNLSSATASDWSVGFSGQPFFVAKTATSVTQAITTTPFWMPHPKGGIMLSVSTGQNLTSAHQTSAGTDTVYALWDKSAFSIGAGVVTITDGAAINTTSSTGLPSSLVQQTITGTVTDSGAIYYASSSNPVDYSTKRGWYLNWSVPGQRVLHNSRAFSGQKVLIQSSVPKSGASESDESCAASAVNERTFLSILNMYTGNPSATPVFSLGDSTIPTEQLFTVEDKFGGDNVIMRDNPKDKLIVVKTCPPGQVCDTDILNPDKYIGMRANWREIQ